jgi:hypothetical protein
MFSTLFITIETASGSVLKLYSVFGVTLPLPEEVPPIVYNFVIFFAILSSLVNARAKLVSVPIVKMLIYSPFS